ncbi:MAG: type III pantothenate kinase [Planctomycetota bacterium]
MSDDPRANASLLILEIGNSHISVATSIGQKIRTCESFGHDQIDAAVDCAKQAWAALPDDRLRAVAAGSVVPDVLARLRTAVSEALQSPVLVVGEELHRPLSSAIESPESVGIDRICAAAAAYDEVRAACVIASFGTAITVDCVNDAGAFLGGAILPGIDLQAKALHAGTAVLPEVSVEETGGVYGGTTEQAIRNGIVYGVVGSLREITERYATDLKAWPRLVVTGGNGELVRRHCDFVDDLVPDLCVRGIALAYRKHFSPFDDELP